MRSFIVHSVVEENNRIWSIRMNEVDEKGENLYGGDSITWYSVTRPLIFIGGIYEVGMTFVGALNSREERNDRGSSPTQTNERGVGGTPG